MRTRPQRGLRHSASRVVLTVALTAGGLVGLALPAGAGTGTTERVSLNSAGEQASNQSNEPSLSQDGRLVAFTSAANNLVPGDNDYNPDVFVRNRETGRVRMVSLTSGGIHVYNASFAPSISANGRYVAFLSDAAYLVPGDTNGVRDGFVHDRTTGRTQRVSLGNGGAQGGRPTLAIKISDDGRAVAFESASGNLVSGDTNQTYDVFLRDLDAKKTTRMSVDTDGSQFSRDSTLGALSGDGRTAAFMVRSSTCNGLGAYVRAVGEPTERLACNNDSGGSGELEITALSGDGRYVAYYTVTRYDGYPDSRYGYVYDRTGRRSQDGCVGPADLSSNGTAIACSMDGQVFVGQVGERLELVTETAVCQRAGGYGAALSGDGLVVAYTSSASSLVPDDTNGSSDIFVYLPDVPRERQAPRGRTTRAAPRSDTPALDGTGARLVFASRKRQFVDGDTNGVADIFLRTKRGKFQRVSVASDGAQANGPSSAPTISADGRFVIFISAATNLVPGDTNGVPDVFLRNRFTSKTTRVSLDAAGEQANGASTRAKISDNRQFVVFESVADNLVSGDGNGVRDVFRKDLRSGEVIQANADTRNGAPASVGDVGDDGSVGFNAADEGFVRAADGTVASVRPISPGLETVTVTSMSADARYVAYRYTYEFYYRETVIEGGTFVHDRQGGQDRTVSEEFYKPDQGVINDAQLSADGSAVTLPTNYGRTVLLVTDRGGRFPVSISDTCAVANGVSYWPAISGDGQVIAYTSEASNLVRKDRNGDRDVFRYQLG